MNEKCTKVLVVEDESSIRKFININLSRNGFEVFEAESGETALDMLNSCLPTVVVLDVMLPGIDGFEVCRLIRERMKDTIIIMLTARGQDMDKIIGLDLGADDYMVKPFNPLELTARIRAILRRAGKSEEVKSDLLKYRDISIDSKAKKVFKKQQEIDLTPREYSIINLFIDNPGKALSRDELLNSVWGRN
jgi:DNA-binding response OmpR family regulator